MTISLVVGLCLNSALADSYPSGQRTIDDVWGTYTPSDNGAINFKNSVTASFPSYIESAAFPNVVILEYPSWYSMCMLVFDGTPLWYNGYWWTSNPDGWVWSAGYFWKDGYQNGWGKVNASNSSVTFQDIVYYRIDQFSYSWAGSWNVYSTCGFYDNGLLFNPPNLLWGIYEPDSRIFEVWKTVEYPESSNPLEYINVRLDGYVDLNKISTQKIRFDYTDQDGNSLYKVFSESDFHDIQYDNSDDIYTFYLFPYLISSYEFTLTGATYYSDLAEWGSKSIELDLTYNEDVIYPLPSGWNDSYYITQYFESNSNGRLSYGRASIGYKVVGIYTYWTDGDLVCWQNFDVKGLFVPDFLTSDFQNNLDMQEVYSLFEQYDVIFTDCIKAEIDGICGQYVYDNTHDVFLQQGFIPALRFLISQGVIQQHRSLPLSVDSSGLSYFDNLANGFIVTRSFLLKRALAALGDVDDRLLEFETNLFDEDGLGVSLQNKLDNLLSQQNTFFSDVSRFFQKLEYGLNGVAFSNIEKWLKDIRDSLVGEFHFDFEAMEHPWVDIYIFVKELFDDGVAFLGDFTVSANAMLNGSSMTSLPISTITVTPALPFNPTPIPIPTIQGGG